MNNSLAMCGVPCWTKPATREAGGRVVLSFWFLLCVSVCVSVRFLLPLIKRPIMDGFQSLRCLWKCLDKTLQSIILKLWVYMGIKCYAFTSSICLWVSLCEFSKTFFYPLSDQSNRLIEAFCQDTSIKTFKLGIHPLLAFYSIFRVALLIFP